MRLPAVDPSLDDLQSLQRRAGLLHGAGVAECGAVRLLQEPADEIVVKGPALIPLGHQFTEAGENLVGWQAPSRRLRAANRVRHSTGNRSSDDGFRLARTLSP